MRKTLGLVALGLGGFLVVLAVLLKSYAYPALAKVPLDMNTEKGKESVSQGTGMSAFYASELKTKDGLTLTSTRVTRADQDAQDKAGGNIAVWDTFVRSTDDAGTVLSSTIERVAFDRTTALAVDCCDQYVATSEDPADRTAVQHKGLFFKFPFDAQQQTYDWWDGSLPGTVPAKFVRTESIEGVETYVYEMVIPATSVGQQEVPGSIIGQEGTVTLDRVYENTRTLWVEPNTGVIIKGQEQLNTRFQQNGVDAVVLQKGTIGYKPETIKENADKWGPLGAQLKLVRSTLPTVCWILGLLALVGGFFLTWRTRQQTATASASSAPKHTTTT